LHQCTGQLRGVYCVAAWRPSCGSRGTTRPIRVGKTNGRYFWQLHSGRRASYTASNTCTPNEDARGLPLLVENIAFRIASTLFGIAVRGRTIPTLEAIIEQAFEAGIACVLGDGVERDEEQESKDDATLSRLLLMPLMERTPAHGLQQPEVLGKAILASAIPFACFGDTVLPPRRLLVVCSDRRPSRAQTRDGNLRTNDVATHVPRNLVKDTTATSHGRRKTPWP